MPNLKKEEVEIRQLMVVLLLPNMASGYSLLLSLDLAGDKEEEQAIDRGALVSNLINLVVAPLFPK